MITPNPTDCIPPEFPLWYHKANCATPEGLLATVSSDKGEIRFERMVLPQTASGTFTPHRVNCSAALTQNFVN